MTIKETTLEALAFRLGQEEYGVDILKVQEIREPEHLLASSTPLSTSRASSTFAACSSPFWTEELGLIERLAA